jgi:hypothetical protein
MNSCAIEMSMVASHLMWLLRTRGIRKRAKADGLTFDETEEGIQWQGKGIDLEKKFIALFAKKGRSPNENAQIGPGSTTSLVQLKERDAKTAPNSTYGAAED